MKRYIWMPIAFFVVGCAFYIYFGITYNAWMDNLYKIVIYAFIVIALHWALKKKDEYNEERKNNSQN
ncbi:MAG: hypothetical protein K6E54_00525 [Bacteroidaceae bacterium]|nr:hypothetical protein [Bacteroidaceae bacterium]